MSESHDCISLLTADHKKVKGLFREFASYAEAGKPSQQGRDLADKILHELTVHTSIEERIFYPLMRKVLDSKEAEKLILEAYEEHHMVKTSTTELSRMDVADERFNAKMKVLTEMVTHHADEEEEELFPKVRKACNKAMLVEVGQTMLAARDTAPKHPIRNEEGPATSVPELLELVKA